MNAAKTDREVLETIAATLGRIERLLTRDRIYCERCGTRRPSSRDPAKSGWRRTSLGGAICPTCFERS